MAKRKLNLEDKSAPGIGYLLLFPIKFEIGAKISLQKKVNAFVEEYKIPKSTIAKLPLLSMLDCKNENEILAKYPAIRKALNTWKNDVLFGECGFEGRAFSDFTSEKLEIILPILEEKLKDKKGKYVTIDELLSLIKEKK